LENKAPIPPLCRNASFDNFLLPPNNPIAHRELANVLLTVKAFAREFPTGKQHGLLVGEVGHRQNPPRSRRAAHPDLDPMRRNNL
jgi:hypothetical protein